MSKIGLIGVGSLGRALLDRINARNGNSNRKNLFYYHPDSLRSFSFDAQRAEDLNDLFSRVDVVFLTIKPSSCQQLLDEIKKTKAYQDQRLPIFISIMAGVPIKYLHQHLGISTPIFRMMLNITIMDDNFDDQVFVYCSDEAYRQTLKRICFYLGQLIWVDDEDKLDVITAVYGCGPAFIASFYANYLDIARRLGLPQRHLYRHIHHLFETTHALLVDHSPDDIISRVSSKGGATQRGLGAARLFLSKTL